MQIGFLRLRQKDLEFHARTKTVREFEESALYVAVAAYSGDAADRRATTIHRPPKVLSRQASLPFSRHKNGRRGKRDRSLSCATIPPLAAIPAGRVPRCGAEDHKDAAGGKEDHSEAR